MELTDTHGRSLVMGLTNLVRLTLVMTVTVILLGAYTRLADAGLGCPDWPGCYGHLTVPDEQHEIALAMALYPELVIEANKAWLEMGEASKPRALRT